MDHLMGPVTFALKRVGRAGGPENLVRHSQKTISTALVNRTGLGGRCHPPPFAAAGLVSQKSG
jgi:hypothetical protein